MSVCEYVWMSASLKFHLLKSTPQGVKKKDFGRWLDHVWGESLWMRLVPLWNRHEWACSPLPSFEKTLSMRNGLSPHTDSANSLILDFSVSSSMSNKFLIFKITQWKVFCYSSPNLLSLHRLRISLNSVWQWKVKFLTWNLSGLQLHNFSLLLAWKSVLMISNYPPRFYLVCFFGVAGTKN
jgi:hypothetical protein